MSRILFAGVFVSLGVLIGCNHHDDAKMSSDHQAMAAQSTAMCMIEPTLGNTAKGMVHFTQVADKVRIVADISGLEPNFRHGFHVHEGTEVGEDGMKAGGHYNPEKHQHGAPDSPEHHAGDFGNITADAQGHAHLDLTVSDITLNGAKNPIVGHAVIVHEKADDFGQPVGNAGKRIGGGIIKMVEQ